MKYGSPSQEMGFFHLPPLEFILDDLMICGGSLRRLVQEVSSTVTEQEMLAAQIMLAVETASKELQDRWKQVTTVGTKAKLMMGKDQMLDEWLRGSLKNPAVLQSVARNTMPEVFGKEREPKPTGLTDDQKKLLGHIEDLS